MANPVPAPAPAPAPPAGVADAVASAPSQPQAAEPAARLVPAAPVAPVEPALDLSMIELLFQPPRRSEQIDLLASALSLAQGQIVNAVKDSKNPHFRSAYSSLSAIWNACRQPLSDGGLAVLQPVTASGKQMVITTILMHKSGQWIEQPMMLTSQQNTPQAIGSTITYGRRYALAAMVGVAPEDDDGEAATRTLPGAVVQDSRSTPLQTGASVSRPGTQVPLEPSQQSEAQQVAQSALNVGASAVPPPPGRPPMKAPGSK